MELEFDRARWMQDDAGCWLCLRVTAAQAARAFVAGMKDAVYTVCMKRKRQKRSLDANAYAWVLMEKIAAAVGRSKDDIYLDMLERYGVFTHLIVKPTAVDMLMREYRLCRDLGEITVNGKTGRQIQAYFGSSQYDTAQMSRLIDGIAGDAGGTGADEGGMGCINARRRWTYRKMLNVRYGNAMDEPVCCADLRLLHRMRTTSPGHTEGLASRRTS